MRKKTPLGATWTKRPLPPLAYPKESASEGQLFGPYGDVRPFVIDGHVRGTHHYTVVSPSRRGSYRATIHIGGSLPATVVQPRGVWGADDHALGPPTRTGIDAIDSAFRVNSRGVGFGAALLTSTADAMVRARDHLAVLALRPGDIVDTTAIDVLAAVDIANDIDAVIAAAAAVTRAADAIIARGDVFASTRLVPQAGAAGTDQAGVTATMAAMAAACGWLGAMPEYTQGAVVAHADFEHGGASHRATLSITHSSNGALDVAFDGALPVCTMATATLTPQRGGLLGAVARVGEDVVADTDVDAAFVLRFEGPTDQARADVLAIRHELLDLRGRIRSAEITPQRLGITLARDAPTTATLTAQLGLILEAWRELVVRRTNIGSAAPDFRAP